MTAADRRAPRARATLTRSSWPPRPIIRRAAGLRTMESALERGGLGPVAGVDEAGRGACAGPLTVAACVLGARAHAALADLDDSKKLTERRREELFPKIQKLALAWSVVSIDAAEVDRIGVHVANIEGMRRAVAGLGVTPGYVLTDGFRVPGLPVPSLPVIGGDATAACIAAASVLAKVSRDRLMVQMDDAIPGYGFAVHKGYSTRAHSAAMTALGPSREHRMSYANVAAAAGLSRDVSAGRSAGSTPGSVRRSAGSTPGVDAPGRMDCPDAGTR